MPLHQAHAVPPRCCYRRQPAAQDTVHTEKNIILVARAHAHTPTLRHFSSSLLLWCVCVDASQNTSLLQQDLLQGNFSSAAVTVNKGQHAPAADYRLLNMLLQRCTASGYCCDLLHIQISVKLVIPYRTTYFPHR